MKFIATLVILLAISIGTAFSDASDECKAVKCDKNSEYCLYECKNGGLCDDDGKCKFGKEGDECDYFDSVCDYPAEGQPKLYCNSTFDGVCKKYGAENEFCDDDNNPCATGFYCATTSLTSDSGVCKKLIAEGKECKFSATNSCEAGLVCNATALKDGVCVKLPGVGSKCIVTGNNYYCSSDSTPNVNKNDYTDCTCVKIPAAADAKCSYMSGCANAADGSFLYCNSTDYFSYVFSGVCKGLPTKGEKCYSGETSTGYLSNKCADGFKCKRKNGNNTCVDPVAKEGEYCSSFTFGDYKIICEDGLVCANKVCAKPKKDGEKCDDSDECNYPSSWCIFGKCTEIMSIGEGKECEGSDDDDDDVMSALETSLQCKEGLACLPTENNATKYTCTKVETKLSDKKACDEEGKCSRDSYCDCNDEIGMLQCIPYPTSQEWVLETYKKVFAGDDDLDELAFYKKVYEEFLPYSEPYRCGAFDDIGAKTMVSVIAILVSLLFFF